MAIAAILGIVCMAVWTLGFLCGCFFSTSKDVRKRLKELGDLIKKEGVQEHTRGVIGVHGVTNPPSLTIVDADDPATIVKMEALERERKLHKGPNPDGR